jgi:hypothetical protein
MVFQGHRFLTFVFLGWFASHFSFAQTDTGTISGIVTDASGAVIPSAAVTITQTDTNVHLTLSTNDAGFYSAPSLHPGPYSVEVSKTGFQTQKNTGIELRVQDRLEINVHLALGTTSTAVTVTGTAPVLESETSSLGQVVESKTIDDLPLNGRTFIQLATLSAGTLPSNRSADKDSFISNGARSVQNSYLLDGVDNKNRIMGFDSNTAQAMEPVIDAIQEFKVQTSSFSAEFGQSAGGVVNVTIKAGTNAYHGVLFEFLRNSDTDATPFFQPAGVGKPAYRQNQFGATFGGPIIRNKTFFFGAWQSSRENSGAPQIASVPTAAEHQGVFPSKVTDPSTNAPFPNNTIPTSRWDTVAAGLLPLYPLPNLPGAVSNFFSNPSEVINADQYHLKFDHHFGDADNMFVRISQGWSDNLPPLILPQPANQQGSAALYQKQFVGSETHVFSPTKVNEFRLGFMYTSENEDLLGPRLFDQYGIKGAYDTPAVKGLPNFTITGFSNLGTAGPGTEQIQEAGGGNYPAHKTGKIWELLDNFSWTRGRHAIKFGTDMSRVTMFVFATNSARPGMTFNGSYTGSGLGDLLLGDVYTGSTSQLQLDTIIQHIYNFYVQDDWKVSKRLTVNFGMRYELSTPFREEHDRQSNFVVDGGPCHAQLILVSQDGMCNAGIGAGQVRLDTNNFAPRLGLAFQATPKTVIRVGSGVFFGRDEVLGIARRLPDNPPFVSAAVFTGTTGVGGVPAFQLQNGFPANALALAASGFNANTTVNSFPFNFPIAYVEQWNFNIERELGGNFMAQLGYTGSEAKKLPVVVNLNQPFPGPGSVNSRRPFQGVGTIDYYAPLDDSSYNALIAKLERRFSKGLSLLTSYTYGHSIDGGGNNNDSNDPGPQDVRNLSAQRGSSNFDVRQRFVVSGFYALPFGRSRGFLNSLVRDWQFNAIYSAQGGLPMTIQLASDPSSTGTTARPNRIGDGNLPAGQRTIQHWFDTSAFAIPTCVCFGNSGRNIVRGPGFTDVDLGVIRNFQIGERMHLQFRAESFNLANHPNFSLPNRVIGNAQVGTITSTLNPERQNQFALKLYF